jgi:hypothetical protein|tara:strand:+ start:71 stop:847 length:777 start_codon:yes stop_codon:yes gene_type:complete
MKKLTIDFEVKGCDLMMHSFSKSEFDEVNFREKVDSGEYDYWDTPLKDYEFLWSDMLQVQINVDLDGDDIGEAIELDLTKHFIEEGYPQQIVSTNSQYPINYKLVYWDHHEHLYGFDCFNQSCLSAQSIQCCCCNVGPTTQSFSNSARWDMLKIIENPEMVAVVFSESFKGTYIHMYSWDIDEESFDHKKLCFHYGIPLSIWDSTFNKDQKPLDLPTLAFLTVTYDGIESKSWNIEPPTDSSYTSDPIIIYTLEGEDS